MSLKLASTLLVAFSFACGGAPSHPSAKSDPVNASHHHGHDGMPHRFDDAERWSKEFDAKERDDWQKPAEVAVLLELEEGMTVADIGAGTGYFLPYLSRGVGSSGQVFALDIEENLVVHMRERTAREGLENVIVKKVDPSDPGLDDGTIDRIVIVDTWHHIGERPAYAEKLKRSLKNGGHVNIVDFDLDSSRGPPKAHKLTPLQVIAELEAAGFDADVVSETLPDQYIVRGTPRL